jgi:ribosomal protein L32
MNIITFTIKLKNSEFVICSYCGSLKLNGAICQTCGKMI